MKIISFNGSSNFSKNYYHFTVENGSSFYCSGDIFWCNETDLEISDYVSENDVDVWLKENEIYGETKQIIKGALRRVGVF